MPRNTIISICKAIAIILMVVGHADCPSALGAFLYEFHMPVFFACAGYFFSTKYLTDEATFVKKRIRGLYLPFLKWAVFFLIIHNWMFEIGILNERYGNWTGGVTHPYSWHQMQQNLWNMVTAMGGYDPFLCGAFWFFRGLFVASIAYLVLFKLLDWLAHKYTKSAVSSLLYQLWLPLGICVTALLLAAWKTGAGLRVVNLVQGGYRDIMGIFFYGCGFLFRQWQHRYRVTWWTTLLFAIVVFLFSKYARANMNWNSTFQQFLSLPLPALCGCLMTYNLATWINKHETPLKRLLVFCGDNTLPIFVFHIVSYKIVSAIKILYYGMDWQQIGCHMVIHDHAQDDLFWILYAAIGLCLPLGWTWCWRRLRLQLQSRLASKRVNH